MMKNQRIRLLAHARCPNIFRNAVQLLWFLGLCNVLLLFFGINFADAQPLSFEKRLDLFLKAAAENCRARVEASKRFSKGHGSFSFNPIQGFFSTEVGGEVSFTTEEIAGVTEKMMEAVNKENAGQALSRQGRCMERFTEDLLRIFHAESESVYPVVAIDSRRYGNPKTQPGDDPLDTNANAIEEILTRRGIVPSNQIFAVRASPVGWDAEVVIYLKPRLVFLHWSTFEAVDKRECPISRYDARIPACIRLVDNLARLGAKTQAPIIVRGRGIFTGPRPPV